MNKHAIGIASLLTGVAVGVVPTRAHAEPATAPSPPPRTETTSSWSAVRTVGVVNGTLGLVAIASGAILHVLDEPEPGTVLLFGGGVALVSGVVVFLAAPSKSSSSSTALRVGPTSVALVGTF